MQQCMTIGAHLTELHLKFRKGVCGNKFIYGRTHRVEFILDNGGYLLIKKSRILLQTQNSAS
jgi:hypothetical protein